MSEIIDLTKNSISNCNLRQHAIFCKYIYDNNNNNNIYLKSNIHKSSIDYKYIHMYNKIMLYTQINKIHIIILL